MIGYSYEDEYILSPFVSKSSIGNLVTISCKTKKTQIRGYLSEGIQVNGSAKWKEMFDGGIGALGKGLLQTGSNLAQIGYGRTIQQPWMNRKFYESTSPFSFQFGINFVSQGDAESQVFKPAEYLLSLIYPRTTVYGSNEESKNPTGTGNNFVGKAMQAANLKPAPGTVVDTALNTMVDFVIPGPSVLYKGDGSDTDNHGDAVTITIGQAFAFGTVYLENVDVKFSETFDSTGFPLYARCTVKATCMDVNYCLSDGSFLISQFPKGQYGALSNFIDSFEKLISDAARDTQNVGKAVVGFFH